MSGDGSLESNHHHDDHFSKSDSSAQDNSDDRLVAVSQDSVFATIEG